MEVCVRERERMLEIVYRYVRSYVLVSSPWFMSLMEWIFVIWWTLVMYSRLFCIIIIVCYIWGREPDCFGLYGGRLADATPPSSRYPHIIPFVVHVRKKNVCRRNINIGCHKESGAAHLGTPYRRTDVVRLSCGWLAEEAGAWISTQESAHQRRYSEDRDGAWGDPWRECG